MHEGIEALVQTEGGEWLFFENPVRLVVADRPELVVPALEEVEAGTRKAGSHAVGFVAYEAGAAFGLTVCAPEGALPLVWFALFDADHVHQTGPPASSASYELGPLAPSLERPAFRAAFDRVRHHLAEGDTYQANLTFRMQGSFRGDPRALFADLVIAQQGRYSAFLHLGSHSICSASPELFFSRAGSHLAARPMKGTARRGRTLAEDVRERDQLRASPKQRAENVMIVDMMRNDLGRIAEMGTVVVPELFCVERYPNVWQMTSAVTARSSASLAGIFAAVHPSASVTGAPKVRTMELLAALEQRPRGVYTGAIGHVAPGGTARFNVAIRTAVVNHRAGMVEFGIGSGLVWDSDAESEYDECLIKGAVLGRRPLCFDLLETLRWTPGSGFLLLERHLARLRDSAEYFGFECPLAAVASALDKLDKALEGCDDPQRVRLLVSRTGGIRVEHAPLERDREPMRVALASEPVDANDVFLFHKTTNRGLYERARIPGFDDVILWNLARQVTESTTANIVAGIDGQRLTPSIECGLLAGTYRAELLAKGDVREAIITLAELQAADRIWLVNSVHEWRSAELAPAAMPR